MTTNDMTIGKVFHTLLAGVFVSMIHAWAVSLLWRWYAVPLDLPELSFAHTYGLLILLGMFNIRRPKDEPHDEYMDWLLVKTSAILMSLGIGYILTGLL